jgi:plastocyanin
MDSIRRTPYVDLTLILSGQWGALRIAVENSFLGTDRQAVPLIIKKNTDRMKMNHTISPQKVAAIVVASFLAMFVNLSQGKTVTVTCPANSDTFSPSSVTINVGDTVTWAGLDGNHNVTGMNSQDLSDFCGSSLSSLATETSCSHTFTTAGTFPYECTIHLSFGMVGTVIVVAAAPTPTVSITNPAANAVFPAPASLNIGATAAVSSGTVTNVAFFAGAISLGSAHAAPFQITTGSLAAGNYALTAVATASGISATSAVVNVSVVSPVAVSNAAPAVVGGLFSFSYDASVGFTYIVQKSLDLINWSPISTNVASSNPVIFTDNTPLSGAGFYRVASPPSP